MTFYYEWILNFHKYLYETIEIIKWYFTFLCVTIVDYHIWFSNVKFILFNLSVMSNSLRPHGLQHARLPCPSLYPRACSNSCPLSRWCHSTISSSVVPFFSCPQSFPASRSFLMSQFFTSGGQSIGASTSASVLPMNIQSWFPLGWTVWSPCSPRGS